MFAQDQQSLDAWMKPSQDMFDYWISFFPTAPLFGVEYRFGDVMGQGMDFGLRTKTTVPTPPAKPEATDAAPVAYERVAQPSVAPVEKTVEPKVETAPEAPVAVKEATVPEEAEMHASAPEVLSKPKGLLAKVPADADDLKLIKGVGPGLEQQLNGLGIYRFRQLAKFKEADLAWVDENLSSFKGRCFRDDWVGQAKALKA